MENQKNGKMNMINVDISDTIDRGELFGGLDKNLKLIEDNFNVDIIQRDNQLILKGDRTSQAEKIIKEMMGVLEKGEKINELSGITNRKIFKRRPRKDRSGDRAHGKAKSERGHRQDAHAAQLLFQKIGRRFDCAMEKSDL